MLHAEFHTAAIASMKSRGSGETRTPAQFGRPIARNSLSGGAYQYFLEAILAGALPPGAELNEVALAKDLQVSRTPVHEALRRLEADGLVESERAGRCRVVSFGRENIVAVYELRKILEGAAAAAAARNITEEALRGLRSEGTRLESSPSDAEWPGRAISFDLHFHDVVAEQSGNEFLRRDILRHRRLVQGFCRLTGNDINLRQAFVEHLLILAALEERHPGLAQEAMVNHIDARLATLLQLLDHQDAEGTPTPPTPHSPSTTSQLLTPL